MKLDNVIAGLTIFKKYGGTMSAYSDEIKSGQPQKDTLTEEEVKTLLENNWHPDWKYSWNSSYDGPDHTAPISILRKCDCWYIFV